MIEIGEDPKENVTPISVPAPALDVDALNKRIAVRRQRAFCSAGPPNTGGKGSITRRVHGEFMVSSETIRSHFTQWVHAEYFLKVPTNSPSENPPGKV